MGRGRRRRTHRTGPVTAHGPTDGPVPPRGAPKEVPRDGGRRHSWVKLRSKTPSEIRLQKSNAIFGFKTMVKERNVW